MIPTFVTIPFKGKIEMTARLVDQILDLGGVNVIFMMDNGGEQETVPWRGRPAVETVRSVGVPLHAMWNEGIERSVELSWYGIPYTRPAQFNVLILNNDVLFDSKTYIQDMAEALRSDPNVAIVTGTEHKYGPWTPQVLPCDDTLRAQGNSWMLRGELPLRLDERFAWYYGDMDIFAQAMNAGYTVGVASRCKHIHLHGGSQTINELEKSDFAEKVSADTELFYAKWPQIPYGSWTIPQHLLRPR